MGSHILHKTGWSYVTRSVRYVSCQGTKKNGSSNRCHCTKELCCVDDQSQIGRVVFEHVILQNTSPPQSLYEL